MSPQTVYPALRYVDADAALRFLADAFGAEIGEVYRSDRGAVAHAQVLIECSMMFVGEYADAASAPDLAAVATPRQSLYVVVGDPDAHHDRARAAGAVIERELADQDYGSREYGVRDPEGHLWSFGTYDPAAAA